VNQNYYAQNKNKLVALYNFNETDGDYIFDSANRYDGFKNNAIQNEASLPNLDKSYLYDGNKSSFLSYTDKLLRNSGTVNVWIKPLSFGGVRRVLMSTDDKGLKLWFEDGLLAVEIQNISNAHNAMLTYTGVTLDIWHMITYTWIDNVSVKLYVDGVMVASKTTPGLLNYMNKSLVRVGSYNNTIQFFNGNIGRVEFWNEQLLIADIEELYNVGEGIAVGITSKILNPTLSQIAEDVVSTNAIAPLSIPTYDGSNQVVHPDIYYNESGWNGWKYWMVMTPYPNGNSSYENPSVVVSNDGNSWQVPTGLVNPLVPKPAGGYNSDPDIIMGYDDKLHIIYRETIGAAIKLFHISSTNGITWSTRTEVNMNIVQYLSPSLISENSGYTMFVVNYENVGYVWKLTSSDIVSGFINADQCRIYDLPNGKYPNHIEVCKVNNTYYAVITTVTGDGGVNAINYFAISSDGINFYTRSTPLFNYGVIGQFDSGLLYRSTLIPNDYGFDLWYSARSAAAWRVGRTVIEI
jgi:hypothetical protein